MATLTNNELVMLRSRMFRGYRAPAAVTEFLDKERIVSMTYNGLGDLDTMVQESVQPDGTKVTKTTVFSYDGSNRLSGSVVTYTYEDTI